MKPNFDYSRQCSNLDQVLKHMEEVKKVEGHLTSAAAFVEGGIQDACDDACSICLEPFCENDPSTVTSCKHEFHLQCILEWCQRSSQCPMCWQPISLKDSSSQELLESIERERSFMFNQSRNVTTFHHATLGDFELQHLPAGANDAEFEERIIQHLTAAAAMGRARHLARREGQRNLSNVHGHPQLLVFSAHPNAPSADPVSIISGQRGGANDQPSAITASTLPALSIGEEPSQQQVPTPLLTQSEQVPATASGPSVVASSLGPDRISPAASSPVSHDRAGSSDLHSFSESLKSRLMAASMKYKESLSKSTKGWKERWFSRSSSVSGISSEVKREVNAGIADVSRTMEFLDTRDDGRGSCPSATHQAEDSLVLETHNSTVIENNSGTNHPNESNSCSSCAASSGSN